MIPVHKMSSESHCWKKEIDTVKNSVHSPLFFRKIVEIERYVLRAAILHECQNYLGGGSGLGEASPPPPTAIIPDARPLGTFAQPRYP